MCPVNHQGISRSATNAIHIAKFKRCSTWQIPLPRQTSTSIPLRIVSPTFLFVVSFVGCFLSTMTTQAMHQA